MKSSPVSLLSVLSPEQGLPTRSSRGCLLLWGFVCLLLIPHLAGCRLWAPGKHWWHSTKASRELAIQGAVELDSGRVAAAEGLLRKAVAACPSDADAHGYLAQALWKRGEKTAALAVQEQACRLAPRSAPHHREAARMQLALGNIPASLKSAESAIDAAPDEAQSYITRAQVYRAQGELEKSLSDVHRALGLAPHDQETMWMAADLYRTMSRPHLAYAMLNEIAQTYPRDGLPARYWSERGLALSALRRHEEAVDSLRMAVRMGPPHADLLAELAKEELNLGRTLLAQRAIQEALAQDSKHPQSLALAAKIQAIEAEGAQARLQARGTDVLSPTRR